MAECMNKTRRMLLGVGAGALLAATGMQAFAEDGVTDKEIHIGMANALTGPASGLGTDLKAGADAFLSPIGSIQNFADSFGSAAVVASVQTESPFLETAVI